MSDNTNRAGTTKVLHPAAASDRHNNRVAVTTAISCGTGLVDTAAVIGVCSLFSVHVPLIVAGGIFLGTSAVMFAAMACCQAASDADDAMGYR